MEGGAADRNHGGGGGGVDTMGGAGGCAAPYMHVRPSCVRVRVGKGR